MIIKTASFLLHSLVCDGCDGWAFDGEWWLCKCACCCGCIVEMVVVVVVAKKKKMEK